MSGAFLLEEIKKTGLSLPNKFKLTDNLSNKEKTSAFRLRGVQSVHAIIWSLPLYLLFH